MTDFQRIRIDKSRDGAVWTVTMCRPEVKNAHDLTTFKEIATAFDMVEEDRDCRCAVLTGEGEFFSAGQDLKFTRSADARQVDAYGRWNVGARQRIQRNYKPVVAAVNGPAIGGGVYLATSCDLIIAVDTAYFALREILAGNHAGGALLHTVGRVRSLEMTLLGRRIPAPQAEAWGMINRSVPAAEFQAAVDDYVNALIELPPIAVRYTKNAMNLLLDMGGYSVHQEAGGPMQRYLGLTPDGREAKAAFNERRKPRFTGAYPGEAPQARADSSTSGEAPQARADSTEKKEGK